MKIGLSPIDLLWARLANAHSSVSGRFRISRDIERVSRVALLGFFQTD